MQRAQEGEPGRARPGVLRWAFAEHGGLGRALHQRAEPLRARGDRKAFEDRRHGCFLRRSELKLCDDDHGAERGDEVQDADLLDVVSYWRGWGLAVSPGVGSPISGSTETTTRARSKACSWASPVMFSSCLAAESEKAIGGRALAGEVLLAQLFPGGALLDRREAVGGDRLEDAGELVDGGPGAGGVARTASAAEGSSCCRAVLAKAGCSPLQGLRRARNGRVSPRNRRTAAGRDHSDGSHVRGPRARLDSGTASLRIDQGKRRAQDPAGPACGVRWVTAEASSRSAAVL